MIVKHILIFFLSTIIQIGLSSPVYAQRLDPDDPSAPDMTKISDNISVLNNAIGANSKLNTMTSPGLILSRLLPYLLTLAGLILFGMLISGGFTMLTGASNPKAADAGKARITNAIVGFIIIFTAYWLTQILEIILGVKI